MRERERERDRQRERERERERERARERAGNGRHHRKNLIVPSEFIKIWKTKDNMYTA